jgi:hypothetical protein
VADAWRSEGLVILGAPTSEFPDGRPIAVCVTLADATLIADALNKVDREFFNV